MGRGMPYFIRVALRSLLRERWVNLLSILTIAMGLLVISLVALVIYNVDLLTRRLPEKFSVVAYLKDGVSEQEALQIAASLRRHNSVEKVRYISKAEAIKELRSSVRDADYILEGLSENPLPASLEIRLRKEAVGPESVKAFADEIKKMTGIEDLQYGEKFLLSIHSLRAGVKTVGLILTLVMAAGVIFICYSTVKILFYRRKEEIETLKLLGATRGFIRVPFLVEGGVIGASGSGISLFIVLALYQGVFKSLSVAAPLFGAVLFPPEVLVSIPFAGLFLGITGALIAVGRIRY